MDKEYNRIILPKSLDEGTSYRTATWVANSIHRRAGIPVVYGHLEKETKIEKGDLVILGGVGGHDTGLRLHQELAESDIDYFNVEKGYCNWWKPRYWRLTFNENQIKEIRGEWDNKRFCRFNMPLRTMKKDGEQVYIVAPSQNGLDVYDIKKSVDQWIDETVAEVKKYTDRPIKIRKKVNKKARGSRGFCDTLENIYCVISLHTMAVTEVLREGIPVISLVPGVLKNYSSNKISQINDLYYPSDNDRGRLFNCLTNIQFENAELMDGTAYETMAKFYDINILPK